MNYDAFSKRMAYVKKNKFSILSLDKELDLLRGEKLPPCGTVITIDDGFYGVYHHPLNMMSDNAFTAKIYITSYYALKENPVFRLFIQYLFWKSRRQKLILDELGCGLKELYNLTNNTEREKAIWEVISFGEVRCDEPKRQKLLSKLSEFGY